MRWTRYHHVVLGTRWWADFEESDKMTETPSGGFEEQVMGLLRRTRWVEPDTIMWFCGPGDELVVKDRTRWSRHCHLELRNSWWTGFEESASFENAFWEEIRSGGSLFTSLSVSLDFSPIPRWPSICPPKGVEILDPEIILDRSCTFGLA